MMADTYLQSRIRALLDATGMSMREASLKAGLNETAVKNILGGRSQSPRGNTMLALAKAFGVQVETLIETPRTIQKVETNPLPGGMFPPKPGRLPLVRPSIGAGKRGLADVQFGWTDRPTFLDGRDDAYALYVPDDRMAPALKTGQIIYVDPSRLPVPGDMVRVILTDGESFLAEMSKPVDSHLVVRMFAEAKPRSIPIEEIAEMHFVVGVCYLRI